MNDQRMYGILPPGTSRLKHKETKSLHPAKRPPPLTATATVTAATTVKAPIGIDSTPPNKLLAGYMAHEFQTKGTLLGQKFDTARAGTPEIGKLQPVTETKTPVNVNERYKEITSLIMMKSDGGVHIPGIVNPTQLARLIQM
ncbi:hypothetical protein R6Q57_010207 [Mikania cordata]